MPSWIIDAYLDLRSVHQDDAFMDHGCLHGPYMPSWIIDAYLDHRSVHQDDALVNHRCLH
eukprot:1158387-Pelagomonas_calceolata.AAC.4